MSEEKAMRALQEAFRPEFIDRIDECIYFSPLSDNSVKKICKKQLDELALRLSEKNIKLEYTQEAVNVISKSEKQQGGARHIRRRIAKYCERPISEKMLSGEIQNGSTVVIDCIDPESGPFVSVR